MNNNYKYLVWAGTAVLVILAIFLLASTNKVINTAATTNTVSFSGEGKVVAKPDIAKLSLSILTTATTSKAAQDDNSKKSKAITDYLQKQGLGEKDIKTIGYNISPQYKYPPLGGQPTITGYQVNQSMEVKVRDLAKVSEILDGVTVKDTVLVPIPKADRPVNNSSPFSPIGRGNRSNKGKGGSGGPP